MHFLSLLIALVLSSCGFRSYPENPEISDELAALVSDHAGGRLDICDSVDFPWTRLCVFRPYTTEWRAQEVLGHNWPYGWGRVSVTDTFNFLVFLNEEEVVATVEHPNSLGDFRIPDSKCYSNDSAVFEVVTRDRPTDGRPYYSLLEPS